MPYIEPSIREELKTRAPQTPSELNYLISTELWKWCLDRAYVTDLEGIMFRYLLSGPINYTRLNEIMGALEYIYREFRRRPQTKPYIFHAAKRIWELQDLLCARYSDEYEDRKMAMNGDVFL